MSNAKKRPAIYIGSDCCIWIGNTSDTAIQCDPGELFGFGTGAFEEKAVSQLDVMVFFCFVRVFCFGRLGHAVQGMGEVDSVCLR